MKTVLHPTSWRPVAHVAVRDDEQRRAIADILHSAGWTVIESRTGYHLVESIADAILGEYRWCQPRLVVVDAISPGCSGVSIARGLRDLGWSMPIVVLLRSPEQRSLVSGPPDDRLYVVEPTLAATVVRELAAAAAPHVASHPPAGEPVSHVSRMATARGPAGSADRARV